MKKTLLFIQLPIPRLTITREDHNIPVAAYYLQSYLQEQPIARQLEFEILSSSVQNYGSDDTILEKVLDKNPAIVCFSLFCWNVERSLYLAAQLKKHGSPLSLAGGPEVTPDNQLLRNPAIDLCVYGEGEITLVSILESFLNNAHKDRMFDLPGTFHMKDGEFHINPPQQNAFDMNTCTSPYLKGVVPRNFWNEMFFETMRGCPFSCRFCYYNKNCGTVRFLSQSTVLELLRYAIRHRYREIFLLDPSFNIRPDFDELLRKMATINAHKQVKIATELRADMIDECLAQGLADAGIYEVELGLQSIHPDTMRQIGRVQDLKKFLRGTLAMLERGIETKIDLIVGLPGDNLEKFKESARWVKHAGLDDYLQVFCLNILPGTFFRGHAEELGLNYSPFPPYYLLSSPDWTHTEIQEAFSWVEDYFGMTFEPDVDEECSLSPVLNTEFQEILYINPRQSFEATSKTTSITKWVLGPIRKDDDLSIHLPAIQTYTRKNPYGIYHVYLILAQEIPLEALFDFYSAFTSLRQQFIDRDLSVLSLEATPIFHYRVEILIKKSLLQYFTGSYLETLRQYWHIEIVNEEFLMNTPSPFQAS